MQTTLVSQAPSARARLGAVLTRWSGRPALLAVAVLNALATIIVFPAMAPGNFGGDDGYFRHCAELLAAGGASCGSPYPPLWALAYRPLTWVSPAATAVIMPSISIALLFVGVALETRGRAWMDRVLVAVAVLTFLPVVYELLLGQTTLLIAAAIYPIARRSDGFRNGIPLGIALALAPKMLVAPFLVWMLVWRRRSLTAVVVTALVLTSLGVIVLGPDSYRDWLSVVTRSGSSSLVGSLSTRDMGNLSLWPLDAVTLPVAALVGAATLWAILRDASRGFVASLLAGLLLAPYSLLYAYSILLLGVKPALGFAPRVTRVLALTANFGHPALLSIIWSLAGIGACLRWVRRDPAAGVAASALADEPEAPAAE